MGPPQPAGVCVRGGVATDPEGTMTSAPVPGRFPTAPGWMGAGAEDAQPRPEKSLPSPSFLCAVPTPEEMSNLTPESSPE